MSQKIKAKTWCLLISLLQKAHTFYVVHFSKKKKCLYQKCIFISAVLHQPLTRTTVSQHRPWILNSTVSITFLFQLYKFRPSSRKSVMVVCIHVPFIKKHKTRSSCLLFIKWCNCITEYYTHYLTVSYSQQWDTNTIQLQPQFFICLSRNPVVVLTWIKLWRGSKPLWGKRDIWWLKRVVTFSFCEGLSIKLLLLFISHYIGMFIHDLWNVRV